MRIVSLLPSATEIICSLGLEEQLVGVTHECDWPPSVVRLPKVTRTLIPTEASSAEIDRLVRERLSANTALYSLDMETLERLKPDLIITQALCDVCAVAEEEVNAAACSLPGQPRVINLEPETLSEVIACISVVASATNTTERGLRVADNLRSRVDAVARRSLAVANPPPAMLLEWIDPPFSCGHWSPELVSLAGAQEVIGKPGQRSRTVAWREIVDAQPELLLIACCGMSVDRALQDLPILRSYEGFGDLACVRNDRVYVMDGSSYFSRPGPRLVDSLEIMAHAFHPDVHPLPPGLPAATHFLTEVTELGDSR
jgi:iron complex transport system substrate-binding protein